MYTYVYTYALEKEREEERDLFVDYNCSCSLKRKHWQMEMIDSSGIYGFMDSPEDLQVICAFWDL